MASVLRRHRHSVSPIHTELEHLEQRCLFVADPVSTNHPTWFANYGTVVVDGHIDPTEWAGAIPVTRAQANRPDSAVTMWFKYTELGLYIAADVRDQYLWADGSGGGSGSRSAWFDDDSLALFFDASVTRKRLLTPAGRALAFNLGSPTGPTSGSGVVSRFNYIAGNYDLSGVQVNPGGALTPGMTWRTILNGTPNNNSDLDVGWTTEVFLPWTTIGMGSMPVNGQDITFNFQVLFDDNNGVHNIAPRDTSANTNLRFGPRVADDQINGVDSSFNLLTPGMEGPINYAWLTFSDPRVNDRPNPVINLSVASIDGYGARLNLLAPAASNTVMALGPMKRGHVYQYEIRWSSYPIQDELDWDSSTEIPNAFVPHPRGQADSLHIAGLEPGAEYYVAVRAVDGVGRLSDIRQVHFNTLTDVQDLSNGERLMTSASGGSLITEAGEPFTMIGSAANPNNLYVRNLYPANVWSASANQMVNFAQTPGPEGDAAGYFDSLASYGVNTLKVPLEMLATAAPGGTVNGAYWLESTPGHFNPAMQQFLWNMMAEANRVNIRLILVPFDTANYRTNFNLTPYSTQNGGPISTINDFFQYASVKDMAINRINTIINWVHQSPDDVSVLGVELPSDWDDLSWTTNPRGDGDPARMQEFRDRSKTLQRIATAVHAYDPNMLLVASTTTLVPRGPVARTMFLGDNVDILAPHWYTASTSEPVNSPDANPSIRPVTDYGALAGYWISSKRDQRVVNNGEWGLVKSRWPGQTVAYADLSPSPSPANNFTLQDDVDLYRTTTWTQIALGLGGSGIRLAGAEARDLIPTDLSPETTGYMPTPLPMGMREIQQSVGYFATDGTIGFDVAGYNPVPLAGRIAFSGTSHRLIGVGSADTHQGMVYVTQDLNRTSGSVDSATLAIDGLGSALSASVEFWSTGADAQQLDVNWEAAIVHGRLAITLPSFSQDVMVRYRINDF